MTQNIGSGRKHILRLNDITKAIKIRCPHCKAEAMTRRIPCDPIYAAVVEVICACCDNGDFCEEKYFDESGRSILSTSPISA